MDILVRVPLDADEAYEPQQQQQEKDKRECEVDHIERGNFGVENDHKGHTKGEGPVEKGHQEVNRPKAAPTVEHQEAPLGPDELVTLGVAVVEEEVDHLLTAEGPVQLQIHLERVHLLRVVLVLVLVVVNLVLRLQRHRLVQLVLLREAAVCQRFLQLGLLRDRLEVELEGVATAILVGAKAAVIGGARASGAESGLRGLVLGTVVLDVLHQRGFGVELGVALHLNEVGDELGFDRPEESRQHCVANGLVGREQTVDFVRREAGDPVVRFEHEFADGADAREILHVEGVLQRREARVLRELGVVVAVEQLLQQSRVLVVHANEERVQGPEHEILAPEARNEREVEIRKKGQRASILLFAKQVGNEPDGHVRHVPAQPTGHFAPLKRLIVGLHLIGRQRMRRTEAGALGLDRLAVGENARVLRLDQVVQVELMSRLDVPLAPVVLENEQQVSLRVEVRLKALEFEPDFHQKVAGFEPEDAQEVVFQHVKSVFAVVDFDELALVVVVNFDQLERAAVFEDPAEHVVVLGFEQEADAIGAFELETEDTDALDAGVVGKRVGSALPVLLRELRVEVPDLDLVLEVDALGRNFQAHLPRVGRDLFSHIEHINGLVVLVVHEVLHAVVGQAHVFGQPLLAVHRKQFRAARNVHVPVHVVAEDHFADRRAPAASPQKEHQELLLDRIRALVDLEVLDLAVDRKEGQRPVLHLQVGHKQRVLGLRARLSLQGVQGLPVRQDLVFFQQFGQF